MDTRFHPAIAKIKSGDLQGLKYLLQVDPSLATDRSSVSHPTLLQYLALEAIDVPNQVELAKALVDAGAEINEPLCACASIDNVAVGEFLLDAGAKVDGSGGWSPLEEALYWGNQKMIQLLLDRGARVQNLRTAAGLGRIDLVRNFFNRGPA